MIHVEKLEVQCIVRHDGIVLLGNGNKAEAGWLRDMLFSWHPASYYGTTVEISEGWLRLPPHTAIHYLAGDYASSHAVLSWSQDASLLRDAAAVLKHILDTGMFMPDREQWHAYSIPAWRPVPLEPPMQADYKMLKEQAEKIGVSLDLWLSQAIAALIAQHDAANAAWDKLAGTFPQLALPGGAEQYELLDEAEWLESVGWRSNDVPFRTALQIVEPMQPHSQASANPDEAAEYDSSWRLRVALLDRVSGELRAVCEPDQDMASLQVPPSWKQYLAGQFERTVVRTLRIAPHLEQTNRTGHLLTSLSGEQAWRFLTEDSLQLGRMGVPVLLPAWWDEVRRRKPRLKAKVRSAAGSASASLLGLQQIVEFDWKLSIGDVQLTEEEFRSFVASGEKLRQVRGRWILLDPAAAEEIIAMLRKTGKKNGMSLRDLLEMYLLGEEASDEASTLVADEAELPERRSDAPAISVGVELNEALAAMLDGLRLSGKLPLVQPPAELRGVLRNYQLQGFSWLVFLRKLKLGGCLADDMGLGKTIQWIAYMQYLKATEQPANPALLICPTSVLGNWQKELQRFAPNLRFKLHHGAGRTRGEQFPETLRDADIILTTYTTAQLDASELSSIEWSSLCLDEAQNIKNVNTKQAAAVRKLHADHRIALTGTPIENKLTELWSIFDFVNPGYLGTLNAFRQKFIQPIEKSGDTEASRQVQRLIKPFLMRRTKKDPAIQLDLPDKHESKSYVPLTSEQAGLYENVLQDMLDRIDTLSSMERRGLILATLTRLKQLCNHPALLKDSNAQPEPGRSNKLIRLIEMVRELREEGDRCLIFTQYVEMGHMLQAALAEELGEPVQFLHGGTPRTARDRMVERFQNASLPSEQQRAIFVLSLKAGGTGLNLTAANHVFHFDRWWNPAVENQATDRAFRIGQTRDVQVHKFISLGTIEERIDEMIERKLELTNQIVGSGENWVTELSTNDLRELFALRRGWTD